MLQSNGPEDSKQTTPRALRRWFFVARFQLPDGRDGAILEQRGNGKRATRGKGGRFTGSLPCDSLGQPFSRKAKRLKKAEYAKVISAISTVYDTSYKGKDSGVITITLDEKSDVKAGNYRYYFEIHNMGSYGDFNIWGKDREK